MFILIFGRIMITLLSVDPTCKQIVTCMYSRPDLYVKCGFCLMIYNTHSVGQCICVCMYSVCGWQMLLDENVDAGVRDCEGLSPTMWACRSDSIEHFHLLTSYQREQNSTRQADHQNGVDERDLAGRTCLHWSVRRVEPLECLRVCLYLLHLCVVDVLITPLFYFIIMYLLILSNVCVPVFGISSLCYR